MTLYTSLFLISLHARSTSIACDSGKHRQGARRNEILEVVSMVRSKSPPSEGLEMAAIAETGGMTNSSGSCGHLFRTQLCCSWHLNNRSWLHEACAGVGDFRRESLHI